MTGQEKADHDASYARQSRYGTSVLSGRRKDVGLVGTLYVVGSRDDAGNGEESNICYKHHGRLGYQSCKA